MAKSSALEKINQKIENLNEIPQLFSEVPQPEEMLIADFTPIHQYVPSYLDISDNSVVILSQDLGFSEKKVKGFCFEPPRVIKSPESIKQFEFIEKAVQSVEKAVNRTEVGPK